MLFRVYSKDKINKYLKSQKIAFYGPYWNIFSPFKYLFWSIFQKNIVRNIQLQPILQVFLFAVLLFVKREQK